jgi:hypothetical protein
VAVVAASGLNPDRFDGGDISPCTPLASKAETHSRSPPSPSRSARRPPGIGGATVTKPSRRSDNDVRRSPRGTATVRDVVRSFLTASGVTKNWRGVDVAELVRRQLDPHTFGLQDRLRPRESATTLCNPNRDNASWAGPIWQSPETGSTGKARESGAPIHVAGPHVVSTGYLAHLAAIDSPDESQRAAIHTDRRTVCRA